MFFPSSPYIQCPKCKEDKFGVLSIGSFSYDRRCASCDYPRGTSHKATYALPDLNKKIIYLDQSVFSNFMKALNPDAKKANMQKSEWKELFEQIDRLNKMQMIVCPTSSIHRQESIVYPRGEDIKRVYELLSHRVSFEEFKMIRGRQLFEVFQSWLEDNNVSAIEHKISRVVRGEINAWSETIYITIALPKDEEWIDLHKGINEQAHQYLLMSYENWKKNPNKKFKDWFKSELDELVKINRQENYRDFVEAGRHMKGLSQEDAIQLVDRFFNTELIKNVPSLRIWAALYAQLGHQVSNGGRIKPKDKGEPNDLKSLAISLPYCDAVVADVGTVELLKQIPKDQIKYKARVFSIRDVESFSNYLKEIEDTITNEHMEKVIEVYGETRITPYVTMFMDKD